MAGNPKKGSGSSSSPKPQVSPSQLRDAAQQQKYREHSKSKHKDTKDVAHTLSLDMAARVLSEHRAPGRRPTDEVEAVKKLINSFENLRMVDQHTNRSEQVKLDNAIARKASSGEKLTAAEEARAKRQVAVLQKQQDELEKVTYQSFRNSYKKPITHSGKVLWDDRKDKADKR